MQNAGEVGLSWPNNDLLHSHPCSSVTGMLQA
jgi:hypothetical protein